MKDLRAKDYRAIANEKTARCSGKLAIITLIYMAIVTAASCLGLVPAIVLAGPLVLGMYMVMANNYHEKDVQVTDLFSGFNSFGKSFGIYILTTIFEALWSLLFFIPGIIASYRYAMAYFIAMDHPELGAWECIDKSKQIMKGHKWQLFCLDFSYIGWDILVGLTCGILGLWITPKKITAHYAFYQNITGKMEEVVDAPAEETK